MAPVKTTLLACVAVLLMPALAPAQEVFKEITSERLEELLRTMKIDYKKDDAGKGTTFYDYKSKGFDLRLWNFKGKDLMIDIFLTKVDWETINKWNSTAKFSRARLNKDTKSGQEAAVLESNLDLQGGVTEGTIKYFIESFDKEVEQWNRTALPAVTDEEIFKKATPDRLEKILNGLNVKYDKREKGELVMYDLKKNNFDLRLTSFGGNDLMIDCIWNGAAPLAKLNQWNLKRHYVRAVLYDNNGKPHVALESNLDCLGGVSESIIRHFITMFWDNDVRDFAAHLKK